MKNTKLKTPAFNQLIHGFEKELIKEERTDNLSYTKEFLSYAEEKDIRSLKTLDQSTVDNYFIYLEKERSNKRTGGYLSPGTISKHRNSIHNFLKYLNAEQITTNSIYLKKLKTEKSKPAVVLSHQEIEWLYSVTDNSTFGYRDRAMLALYYGCGMRKIEGLRLLLTDIDFGTGRIHIRKTKTNRAKYVAMPPKAQQHLQEYIYSARDLYLPDGVNYEELFIGERGNPIHPQTMSKRLETLWKRVKEIHGTTKHIGLHTLRHSIGTHLYMSGMDIEMVALMLGHRTLESTQLYIHAAEELKNKQQQNNQQQLTTHERI